MSRVSFEPCLIRQLFLSSLVASIFLSGCGGSSYSVPPAPVPAVTISVTPAAQSVAGGDTEYFTATVQNTTNSVVSWKLTTQAGAPCSPGCGALSDASANPVIYTAPPASLDRLTIIILATSSADNTKSASATIRVPSVLDIVLDGGCGAGTESKLKGQYAFLVQGFDASGPMAIAGTFSTDAAGTGVITAAQIDVNSRGGITFPSIPPPFSTYSVGADNQGCLTLITGSTTTTYRFVLTAFNSGVGTKGRILQFDPAGNKAVGVIERQDPTAFSVAQVNGDYAFAASSPTLAPGVPGRFGIAGRFNASAGGVTGIADANDNSTAQAIPSFAGSYTVASNGRGTLTIPVGGNPIHASFYIVSADELLLMSIDPQTGPLGNPPIAGSALHQLDRPFSISSLKGTNVIWLEGRGSSANSSDVQVGLFVPVGNGSFTFAADENNGGVITSNPPPVSGTYIVDASGRVTTTGAAVPGIIYLVGQNKGFVLGTDARVATGFFEPQVGTSFTNASLSGNYGFGDLAPVVSSSALKTGIATPNGAVPGSIGGTALPGHVFVPLPYTVSSNGRAILGTPPNTNTLYIVSSSKAVFISGKPGKKDSTITIVEK